MPNGRADRVYGILIVAAVELSILASILALYVSVWPGRLSELIFYPIILSPVLAPVLYFAAIGIMAVVRRCPRSRPIPMWQRCLLGAIPVVLVGSLTLILYTVPFRVAFRLARPRLEALVATASRGESGAKPLGQHFGPYFVDEYGADKRGGVYFRVMTGIDGFVDTMSYGFAFRPNPEGTPFGRARYDTFPLGNDWYWFQASNDYW